MKETTEVLSKTLHDFKVCVNQEGNSVNMDEVRHAIHIMNTSINDMNNIITMSMESPAKKRKLALPSSEDHAKQRQADLQELVDGMFFILPERCPVMKQFQDLIQSYEPHAFDGIDSDRNICRQRHIELIQKQWSGSTGTEWVRSSDPLQEVTRRDVGDDQ